MSSFSPKFVKSLVKDIFPSLRKTQSVNLSLGVFGIIKSRSGVFSEIVREVPGAAKHKHRLKRFWRFISNPRVKPEWLTKYWIHWCVRTFTSGKYIPVALDWTSLPGNIQCLMTAIPFHGRAIPLIWRILRYSQIKDSQNLIEERLISRLTEYFPRNKKIILIADRGFGRAEFAKFLIAKSLLFVLRVQKDVIITTKKGRKILLAKLALKAGKQQWFTGVSYRADGLVKTNLAAVVAEGSDDPWFLVTNLRKVSTAISRYESRFQIEEWFKDVKHELGIDGLKTKNLKRVRRMLFIACVAYGVLMLAGTVADRFSTWRDSLVTGGKQSVSRIWFALRIIKHQIAPAYFWRRVWWRVRGP